MSRIPYATSLTKPSRVFCEIQSQYSLLSREIEWDIIPCCKENLISIIPYSPLKGGLLTGKYLPEMKAAPANTRINWAEKTGNVSEARPSWTEFKQNPLFWQLMEELKKVAIETKKSKTAVRHSFLSEQVALRWLLDNEIVPAVTIGVRNLKQFEEILSTLDSILQLVQDGSLQSSKWKD